VGGPGRWLDWYAAVITGAQDLARWRMLSLLARARPWEQSRELQLALRPIYFADPLCISDRSRRCLVCGEGERGGFAEVAEAVAEILKDGVHRFHLAEITALVLEFPGATQRYTREVNLFAAEGKNRYLLLCGIWELEAIDIDDSLGE
jgi:hypothetical protein